MKFKIHQLLKVKEDELFPSFLIFSLLFILSVLSSIGLSVAESLFIDNFGVANVPKAFLLTSLVIIVSALLANHYKSKTNIDRFTINVQWVTFILWALNTLAIFILPQLGLVYLLLFTLVHTALLIQKTVILSMFFASFDLRQSKRIFPLVAAGSILGFSLGGFSTVPLIELTGSSRNLLILPTVLSLAIALLCLYYFKVVTLQQENKTSLESIWKSVTAAFSATKQSRLYLYLGIMSTLVFMAVMHYDYLYMFYVKVYYKDPEKITQVFGTVRGISTIVTFFVQIFLSGTLLRYLGLTGLIFAFPLIFLVCSSLLFYKYNFFNIFFGRYGYYITKESLHNSSFFPMFNALKEKVKDNASLFINVIMAAFGNFVAALFLILFVDGGVLTEKESIPFSLAIALSLIVVGFQLKKYYVKELIENLKENSPKQLDMLAAVKHLGSKEAETRLKTILVGNDKLLILFSVESLQSMSSKHLDDDVLNLLKRFNDVEIAKSVLHYFVDRESELYENVGKFMMNMGAKTQSTYIHFLSNKIEDDLPTSNIILLQLKQLTHSPVLDIRLDAGLALCKHPETKEGELKHFLPILQDVENERCLSMLKKVAEYKISDLYSHCLDIKDQVQKGSEIEKKYISILAKIPHPMAFDYVLHTAFNQPELRHTIKKILTHISDSHHVAMLNQELMSLASSPSQRFLQYYLTQVLIQLKKLSPEVELFILKFSESLRQMDTLKFQIADQFYRFSIFKGKKSNEHVNYLNKLAYKELLDYHLMNNSKSLLAEYDKKYNQVFSIEIDNHLEKKVDFIFNILEIIHGKEIIQNALKNCRNQDKIRRIQALETLENTVSRKLWEPLQAILDKNLLSIPKITQREKLKSPKDFIRLMFRGDSSWLIALGLYVADEERMVDFKEAATHLHHPEPLIQDLRQSYLKKINSISQN